MLSGVLFTKSSPVFRVEQQASYDHWSHSLESRHHLQQFPRNWILEAEAKPHVNVNFTLLVFKDNLKQLKLTYNFLLIA